MIFGGADDETNIGTRSLAAVDDMVSRRLTMSTWVEVIQWRAPRNGDIIGKEHYHTEKPIVKEINNPLITFYAIYERPKNWMSIEYERRRRLFTTSARCRTDINVGDHVGLCNMLQGVYASGIIEHIEYMRSGLISHRGISVRIVWSKHRRTQLWNCDVFTEQNLGSLVHVSATSVVTGVYTPPATKPTRKRSRA